MLSLAFKWEGLICMIFALPGALFWISRWRRLIGGT